MTKYLYDHMHLRSPDPETTAQWYGKMFGAEILRTTVQGKPRVDVVIDGVSIFIAEVANDGKTAAAPVSPYQGLDHFGLRVANLDSAVAELKAKGAEFTMEPTAPRPGIRISFLRGPQNVSIELLERS
jgi:catechol 2,3-dioxygenase-like lactoylglutathione lyase family enzyme